MYDYQVAIFGAVYTPDASKPDGISPVVHTMYPPLSMVAVIYEVDAIILHESLMRWGFSKIRTSKGELVVVERVDLYINNNSIMVH